MTTWIWRYQAWSAKLVGALWDIRASGRVLRGIHKPGERSVRTPCTIMSRISPKRSPVGRFHVLA